MSHAGQRDQCQRMRETKGLAPLLQQGESYSTAVCDSCGAYCPMGRGTVFRCHKCRKVAERDVKPCVLAACRILGPIIEANNTINETSSGAAFSTPHPPGGPEATVARI